MRQHQYPLALASCCLLTLASVALGESAQTDWYGEEYQQCNRQTTVDIVSCVQQHTSKWERRLNEAYRALSSAIDASRQRDQLHQAQQRWAEYRDANCEFYSAAPGSLSRIAAAECLRVMTASRAQELEQASRQ